MSTRSSSLRLARGCLLLLAAGLAGARAQTTVTQLAPVITTATRLPESSTTIGSATDVVSGADLAREQLTTLADALSGTPSAPNFATGQLGGSTSLFLRGANSDQVLFLVDGIRLNDANTDYANFLGGARIFPTDTIEIARGPQSTLYGADAVGGVVALRTAPGAGTPAGTFQVEGGSFGTVDAVLTAQGAKAGAWDFNLGAAAAQTNNDRINNRFDSGNLALRVDDRVLKDLTLGVTLRGFISRYGDPGDEFTNNPYDYEKEDNWLGTIFADARLTELITSHLIVGAQDRRLDTVVPTPGQPADVTVVKNLRGVVDWQLTGQLTEHNQVTAGTTLETQSTVDSGFGDISKHQTLTAFFAQDEWSPLADLHLTGGLRHDEYSTFGSQTTGRATLAWLVADNALKLRASYGTGFNAPSFLDLYARDPFFVGNPSLQPERSRGWDGGFDYYLPNSATVLSATGFVTEYRNLIVDNFNVFPSTTANVGSARTRGVELALQANLTTAIKAKLAYTYLEARDLTDQTPLLRRPRNSLNGDAWANLGGGYSVGVGGTYVGRRPDVDAQTFATIEDPSYTVVRIYAACDLTPDLSIKLRIENALNRDYEPVDGYPQASRGIYGSASLKF